VKKVKQLPGFDQLLYVHPRVSSGLYFEGRDRFFFDMGCSKTGAKSAEKKDILFDFISGWLRCLRNRATNSRADVRPAPYAGAIFPRGVIVGK